MTKLEILEPNNSQFGIHDYRDAEIRNKAITIGTGDAADRLLGVRFDGCEVKIQSSGRATGIILIQHEWYLVFGTHIGQPIPAKHTFNSNDNIVEEGKNQFKKGFRVGVDVFVHFGFTGLIENTHVHFPCVRINATIIFVLSFVKTHSLASFWLRGLELGVIPV